MSIDNKKNELLSRFLDSFIVRKINSFIELVNSSKLVVFLLSIILFLAITLPLVIQHIPHYDEIGGWMTARAMIFTNYFDIMQKEGHGIIWYLLIMPFAKNNLFYPYSLLFVNYVFCLLFVLFMWKKAPFDNVIKIILTFSYFVLYYFAPVARCYSIGILGLFLLVHYYKDAQKRPFLYSFLIGLTFNTSLMAAIPASYFALLFYCELWKKRTEIGLSKVISVVSVSLSMIIFFFIPLFLGSGTMTSRKIVSLIDFNQKFSEFFIPEENFIFPIFFIFLVLYVFKKSKSHISAYFLAYTYIILTSFLTFVYDGELHHRLFYLVYLILAIWMNYDNLKNNKFLLYVIMSIVFFAPFNFDKYYGSKFIPQFIKHVKKFHYHYTNSVFFVPSSRVRTAIEPYFSFDESIGVEKIYGVQQIIFDNDYSLKSEKNRKKLKDYASNSYFKVFIISDERIEEWTNDPEVEEKLYKGFTIYKLKNKEYVYSLDEIPIKIRK